MPEKGTFKYKELSDKPWLYHKYWEEELSAQRIADIVGCKHSATVLRALKWHGIKRRSHSKAQSGRKHANYGKHLSEETRGKISKANKGKVLSEATKRKLSEINKGKKQSDETKRKISKSRKGKRSPMYGKKHTDDTKEKMSEMMRGKNNPFFGKRHTKLTKEKMSEVKRGAKNPNFGKPFSKERKDKLSKSNRGKHKEYCGDKHWNWKGGITNERKRLWSSAEWREWRRQVFERDDYTCQICKKRGVTLCAHHIKPFAAYPKLRFDINNGITLCEACHLSTFGKEDIYVEPFISLLKKE